MNLGHLIENETEEIQQKVEDCLVELKEIREKKKLLEERNELLRGQLINTLELMGIGVGNWIHALGWACQCTLEVTNIEN